MKKRNYIFLLVTVMAFCLSACGTDKKTSNHTNNTVSEQENSTGNEMGNTDAPDGFVKVVRRNLSDGKSGCGGLAFG